MSLRARTPDRFSAWLVVTAVLALFAALTTPFAVEAVTGGGDAASYKLMSAAAPDLPTETIGSAYTGRFAVHYAVGLLSAAGISLNAAYIVSWLAIFLGIVALTQRLISTAPVGALALALAVVVLNPYGARVSALEMGGLQDPAFALATGCTLLGLLRGARAWVLIGVLAAVLSRQTALVSNLVVAAWVCFGPLWRERSGRERLVMAGAVLALTFGAHAVVDAIVSRFSEPYEPTFPGDTLRGRVDDPPSAGELASHLARTALPLLVPAAVVASLVQGLGVRRVPGAVWWSLGVAAAIVAQPAVIDPAFPGFAHNEQRLAALSLLCGAAAIGLLAGLLPRDRIAPWFWWVACGLVVLASLHDQVSRLSVGSEGRFAALQLVVAVGVLAAGRSALRAQPEANTST